MNRPVLGIQLFTLRDYCKNPADFAQTIAFVKSIGSNLVQVSGVGKDEAIPADFQKAVFDDTNVECCVTHTPWKRIIEDIDNVIKEHKLIGCNHIGLGAPEEKYRGTQENVEQFLSLLAPSLEKIKENGMTFNYHNHDFEFKPLESGELYFDYLINNTDPEVFHFTPDVGWIDYAGYNPVEYLEKIKGRVDVCHFKDYKIVDGERKFVTLGEGEVDLAACYKACVELAIPYIVYEQDCDWIDDDAKKATELSWQFMKKTESEF